MFTMLLGIKPKYLFSPKFLTKGFFKAVLFSAASFMDTF